MHFQHLGKDPVPEGKGRATLPNLAGTRFMVPRYTGHLNKPETFRFCLLYRPCITGAKFFLAALQPYKSPCVTEMASNDAHACRRACTHARTYAHAHTRGSYGARPTGA